MKPGETIEVLPPGIAVRVGIETGDTFRGIISSIKIREDGVRYCVAWYNGRERAEGWVTRMEIDPDYEVKPMRIGFGGAG